MKYEGPTVKIEDGRVYVSDREIKNPILKALVKISILSYVGAALLIHGVALLSPLILIIAAVIYLL